MTAPYSAAVCLSCDDGATDTTPAFNAARQQAGPDGVVRFVRSSTGVFKFLTPLNLNGVTIDCDPNVTLSVTQNILDISSTQPVRVLNKLSVYFSDINFSFKLYPQNNADLIEKTVWLDDSDFDYSYRENIEFSAMRHEFTPWPDGDEWKVATNVTLGYVSQYWPYIYWGSGAQATWYRSSVPVRVGDDLTAAFSTDGVFNRACFVQYFGGYIVLYATGVNGELVYARKDYGVPYSANQVAVGDIFTTQPQYYAEDSKWQIKILTRTQFVILLNGVQISGVLTAPNDILRAGFGYMPQGANNAVAISGFIRTRNGKAGGRQPETVTTYGDSMTAPIHGGWVYWMRMAMEGAGGTVVASVTNNAVPGYTSAQVYAAMQQKGYNGGTAVIFNMTNDIQGLIPVSAFLSNIANQITHARLHNQLPIVVSAPLWYGRAEAVAAGALPGTGQDAGNANAGADYRVGLEHLCAALGVKLVDLTQVSGPVDARYLTSTAGMDSALRDIIHETPYCNAKFGIAIAKAILGERSGQVRRRREMQRLSIMLVNGWSLPSDLSKVAQISVGEDGKAQLCGLINAPGAVVQTEIQVGWMREDECPLVPIKMPICTSGGICIFRCSTAGVVTVEGFQAGWTSLDLSAVSYATRQ